MNIREINVVKLKVGWLCDVTFKVTTVNQFTDEEHTIRSHGRWLLGSVWNAMRSARREHRALRATKKQRESLG